MGGRAQTGERAQELSPSACCGGLTRSISVRPLLEVVFSYLFSVISAPAFVFWPDTWLAAFLRKREAPGGQTHEIGKHVHYCPNLCSFVM